MASNSKTLGVWDRRKTVNWRLRRMYSYSGSSGWRYIRVWSDFPQRPQTDPRCLRGCFDTLPLSHSRPRGLAHTEKGLVELLVCKQFGSQARCHMPEASEDSQRRKLYL